MHAWLRADLVAALAMADGKDRQRALDDFEANLYAPADGWDAMDRRLHAAVDAAG